MNPSKPPPLLNSKQKLRIRFERILVSGGCPLSSEHYVTCCSVGLVPKQLLSWPLYILLSCLIFFFQFSPVAQSCLTLCYPMTAACQASLSITNSQILLRLLSIESVMPSISSSIILFSSCLQFFPGTESFPMSQFFALGGQSIGVSASTSVLPMNTQD